MNLFHPIHCVNLHFHHGVIVHWSYKVFILHFPIQQVKKMLVDMILSFAKFCFLLKNEKLVLENAMPQTTNL